jgi:hypothetical protein
VRKRVAIIGSHGLYASYGGWDQLVNNLAELKSESIEYLIFNSIETTIPQMIPQGVEVKRILIPASGFLGLFYDFWSVIRSAWKVDTVLLLGVQGIPLLVFIKIFRDIKIISNVGGIEWERPKFGYFSRLYLRLCFHLASKFSQSLILDNQHYISFTNKVVDADIHVIPYGGAIDHTLNISSDLIKKHPFLESNYFLSISRALEDNMMYELCSSFRNTDKILVLISNFSSSRYGMRVYETFENDDNIFLINGLYVKPELDLIRRSCVAYIHTHTLCGTAPSLVEMIVSGRPILSVDIPQNRFTLQNQSMYYSDFGVLRSVVENTQDFMLFKPSEELAQSYNWKHIVERYENLYNS